MNKILDQKFFNRPTQLVARELLGKFLVRKYRGREIASMITEVEAYDGFKDKGSHAYRGMTPRNEIMFGGAGYWYVYFTYGMHWLVNVTTRERGYPAAVLLRGIEGAPGPARLTRAMKITGAFNRKKAGKKSGLWIEDRGMAPSRIKKSPRIGINYAGPYWAGRHLRFELDLKK